MTDYEMGLCIKRLRNIVRYAEKQNCQPTTIDLWDSRDLKDYHQLREQLAFMEKDGLVRRHPEDRWSWSVTYKGKGFIHAWRAE